jgi:hypothetical protein
MRGTGWGDAAICRWVDVFAGFRPPKRLSCYVEIISGALEAPLKAMNMRIYEREPHIMITPILSDR